VALSTIRVMSSSSSPARPEGRVSGAAHLLRMCIPGLILQQYDNDRKRLFLQSRNTSE
jgi:hypothetical protein